MQPACKVEVKVGEGGHCCQNKIKARSIFSRSSLGYSRKRGSLHSPEISLRKKTTYLLKAIGCICNTRYDLISDESSLWRDNIPGSILTSGMTVTMAPHPWAGQQAPEMRLELFAAGSQCIVTVASHG